MSMSQGKSNGVQTVPIPSSKQIWVELKTKDVRLALDWFGWLACILKLSYGFGILPWHLCYALSGEINDLKHYHGTCSFLVCKLFVISIHLLRLHISILYAYVLSLIICETHQPQNHRIIGGVIFTLHKPVIINQTNTLQQLTLISTARKLPVV